MISKLKNRVVPETKGRVGEVWRAVEVSDTETAPDISHGGQGRVTSLHDPSLNRALTSTVAKSHQAIVFVQTGGESDLIIVNVSLISIKTLWFATQYLFHHIYWVLFPSHQFVCWPVTHHPPSGESGLVADEGRVVWVSAPQHRIGAHVTLTLPRGKVPVRDRKVLVPGHSLQDRQTLLNWVYIGVRNLSFSHQHVLVMPHIWVLIWLSRVRFNLGYIFLSLSFFYHVGPDPCIFI